MSRMVEGRDFDGVDDDALRPPAGPPGPAPDDDVDHTDALGLLAAAVRAIDDPDLVRRYQRLLLDADALDAVRPYVAGLPGPSAADVMARAVDRFDVAMPDPAQIVVAATARPGEPVRRALWLLGADPAVVAYEAADADARRRRHDNPVTDGTATLTLLNALLSVTASVFIVRYAVTTGHWFTLPLVYLVWIGHPAASLLLVGLAWYATDDVTAATAFAVAVCEFAQARAEQRGSLARTGIALTMWQWRTHVRLGSRSHARVATAVVQWRRGRRLGAAGDPPADGGRS